MEITIKPKCSVCTTEKKETNNWFMAVTHPNNRIVIMPMPEIISSTEVEAYTALCGHGCVSKYVSSNLDELHKHPF